MEEKKVKNNDKTFIIISVVIMAVIFIPIIIGLISSSASESREFNHETKLIQEGKSESPSKVLDKIINDLKDRKKEEFKKLLTEDFVYCNNGNKIKKISNFWDDLKKYEGKYYTEQRGNSIKNHETYWIYWNIPEKTNYNEYTENYQQRIMIYLKKVVKEDIITYEIEKIILKDN